MDTVAIESSNYPREVTMIVEYIRYTVPAERAPELINAYQQAADLLASSPHSLGYDVAQCTAEPGSIVVRMHWDSADGHLSGFRRSPEFKEFFALVRPFVDAIAEMRHYEVAYDGFGEAPR